MVSDKNSNISGANCTASSSFTLRNLIYRKTWEEVERACQCDPSQAKVTDRMGDLPLHEACLQAAPFHVIKSLLSAHPAGVKERGFCGRLPLHYASYNKPSLNIIKLLLQNYPEGASTMDSDGRLPIHLAVVRNAPKGAIQALISAYPKSLSTPNKFGSTPHMLTRNKHIQAMLQEEEEKPRNIEQTIDAMKRFKMAWSASNVLVCRNDVRHIQVHRKKIKSKGDTGSERSTRKRNAPDKAPLVDRGKQYTSPTLDPKDRRLFPIIEKTREQSSNTEKRIVFTPNRLNIPTPPGTTKSTFPVIEAPPFEKTYSQPYTPNTMVERAILA